MIFHDDDIMYPNMLSELYNSIIENTKNIAVGANAAININGKTIKKYLINISQENIILDSKEKVVYRYLNEDNVPLSSFLYKRDVAIKLHFNILYGGKYCDFPFIMDVSTLGNIIYLAKPLMVYFYHKGQDSGTNDFLAKIKLINHITKTTKYNRKDPLAKKFRLQNIHYELKNRMINGDIVVFSNRYFKILKLIFRTIFIKQLAKFLLLSLMIFLNFNHQKK